MRANKIFFDLFSSNYSIDNYKEYYDKYDTVYIALLDAGIYTKVSRKQLFEKNMFYGHFIEHRAYDTFENVRDNALEFINEQNLMYVEPDIFIKIENKDMLSRTKKAFDVAERLIKDN